MFAAFVRFAVTVAAVPLCAEYLDGVKMLDLTNALVVGVILAAIYTVLRPVMRLILSVLNFCTLGCSTSRWMHGWYGPPRDWWKTAWCLTTTGGRLPWRSSLMWRARWWMRRAAT